MSDEVLIEELRTAMRAEVQDIEVPPGVVAHVLESSHRPRLGLGWLMPAVAIGVAVIVAVVAVTSLTHRSPGSHAASSVPVAARGLASRLAVLRRPQRPSDVLPGWAVRETESLTHNAQVVRGLSRLVGAVDLGADGKAHVYLVVQKPPRFPVHCKRPCRPVLKASLGDDASIAFVGRFREEAAINGPTVAAGGDELAATRHGLTGDARQSTNLWGAVASIVPDGVTRVQWVFTQSGSGSKPLTVWPKVHGNVALAKVPTRRQVFLSSVAWYGAHGRVIASFGASSGPAVRARKFKQALETGLHQRIAPALLKHFAVLGGPHASRGLSFAQVASLIEPNPLGLNTRGERFVVDPSGPAKVFVVPGTQGIALYYLSPIVGQAEDGTSGALDGSLVTEGPRIAGKRTIIGLAPDGNRVVRVLLAHGRSRRVEVVDNVYAATVPASVRTVILKNADGHTVRLRVG